MSDSQIPGVTPDNDQPSDPQTPASQPAPAAEPAPPAYAAAPPAAPQAPAYAAAPSYAPPAAPAATRPGRTLGIVAFVVSFFSMSVLFGVAALIMGIIAMVQSRKAGEKNGFALAAIIISAVLLVIGIIVLILIIVGLAAAGTYCANTPGACSSGSGY